MQEQKELLKTHQSTSDQLHKDYQAINKLTLDITNEFGKAGESMASSINKIKDAGQGYFNDFSKQHTEAISHLQSLISNLEDSITSSQWSAK